MFFASGDLLLAYVGEEVEQAFPAQQSVQLLRQFVQSRTFIFDHHSRLPGVLNSDLIQLAIELFLRQGFNVLAGGSTFDELIHHPDVAGLSLAWTHVFIDYFQGQLLPRCPMA